LLRRLVSLAAALTVSTGLRAETDWQAATKVWTDQYRELATADAARRLCGLEVSAAVASALRTATSGVAQALGGLSPSGERVAVVEAAGGPKRFCGDTLAMAAAKATVARIGQQVLESGANVRLPMKPVAAPPPSVGATPVIDPNVTLIQGCRDAVNRRLGPRRTSNKAFWAQYEACMGSLGAGWF
jgi:hypothetical protein